jgi:glutamine transport system substrate-binding protein
VRRAACLVILLTLCACGPAPDAWREQLPQGVLRIGIDPSNPPFAYATDDPFSPYAGFEIDLSRALAACLHVEFVFVGLGYDGLYDALSADRADVVIAALPIDPARRGAVAYSTPYFNAGLVLVTRESAVRGMADLAGRTLAFEYGAIAHGVALEWTRRIARFTLQPHESAAHALSAVQSGAADAALTDAVSARLAQRATSPALHSVQNVLLAAATRADRPSLGAAIDAAVRDLSASGALTDLEQLYFD